MHGGSIYWERDPIKRERVKKQRDRERRGRDREEERRMIRVQLGPCYYWKGHKLWSWTDLVHSSTFLLCAHTRLLKILSLNPLIYNIKIISVVNEVLMLMRTKYKMSLIE